MEFSARNMQNCAGPGSKSASARFDTNTTNYEHALTTYFSNKHNSADSVTATS